jgi:uncharacterized cupredoxin-like copper-binding protein
MAGRMNWIGGLAAVAIAGAAFAHEDHKPARKDTSAEAGHAQALGRPGDPKKVSRTVEVSMSDDMRFKPAAIAVKRNETIRFVVRNDGKIRHEMVLGSMAELKEHAALMQKFPEMEHDDPNAATVEPGKTGTLVWQFTRAGTFDFACLQPGHFEAGMVGKLSVK